MAKYSDNPLMWTRDKSGGRHLCPSDHLSDYNSVRDNEIQYCVDDDSRLESRDSVPSNDSGGRIKFPKSVSLN